MSVKYKSKTPTPQPKPSKYRLSPQQKGKLIKQAKRMLGS